MVTLKTTAYAHSAQLNPSLAYDYLPVFILDLVEHDAHSSLISYIKICVYIVCRCLCVGLSDFRTGRSISHMIIK